MTAESSRHRSWTPDTVRALGLTTDLPTAAQIIGIGRSLAYDLAKVDKFPVRILRIGGRVVIPVADLLQYLGASPEHDDGPRPRT
jgi:predicted DNA-binding transcriptional regulator AlpA